MNNRLILIILLALPLQFARTQVQVGREPVLLDMPKLLHQSKTVVLSDLATQVRYIALETTPKYLIGEKTVSVKPAGGLIFISEHDKPVGVFDETGKFLRTIGKIGKGPGEYNFDYLFWPDATRKQVYVWNADAGTIMAFGWDGTHIGNIKPEFRPGAFVPLGNGRFLTWNFMQEEKDGRYYRLIVHDDQGQTITRFYEPRKTYDFSRGIAIMTPLMTPCPDGFLYNTWENDTIFRAKAGGNLSPALAWRLGKLRMPYDPMTVDYQKYMREKDTYIQSFNAVESGSRWFINYHYKGQVALAILEKATGTYYHVANPDTAAKGIWNDLDEGPSFWPYGENGGGTTFIRLVQAIDLIDHRPAPPDRTEPRQPDQARKLRELVAKLTENSNPVLMLVDLK